MGDRLTQFELGAILSKIRTQFPDEAADLEKYLEDLAHDSTKEIVDLIVKPQVNKIADVVDRHNNIELQRIDLERERLRLYAERTKLLQDSILPKVMPVVIFLSMGLAWVVVAGIASLFEVDINDIWQKIPELTISANGSEQ